MLEWTERTGGGWITTHPKVGLIEIYNQYGHCVDINSKRAWSAWRESMTVIKREISAKVREWEYLNSFIP